MRVMIVDNNPKARGMIKKVIVNGVDNVETVYECSDGQAAIDLYRRERPDWVLMDVEMEPVDGLTATRTILNSSPNAKVIIVTGYDDAQYRDAARSAGVHAYVLKEHMSELREIIRREKTGGRDK